MTDMIPMRQIRNISLIEILVSQKNNGNSLWHIGALRRPRLQVLNVELLKQNNLLEDIELGQRATHKYVRRRGKKRPNKEPSRTDIFILTHTPKDGKGKPINKVTADVISRLREEAQKKREGSASDSMDDVFAKVVGPDTRDTKRTYGPVLNTNELCGKSAAKVSLRQAVEAKRKAEEEAATLRERMMEMEENNKKLQAEMANANSPANSGMKERRMSTDGRQKNQHVNRH